MPEYRRFISYFYEYIDGKKQGNVGFAKVELRSGMWRVLFRLTAVRGPEPPVRVYGFVRERGFQLGLLMGTMRPGSTMMEEWAYRADTPIWQKKYGMADLAGIWIVSGDGRCFATVWDEEPVFVEKFVLELPEEVQEKASEEAPEAKWPEAKETDERRLEPEEYDTADKAEEYSAERQPAAYYAEKYSAERQPAADYAEQQIAMTDAAVTVELAAENQEPGEVATAKNQEKGEKLPDDMLEAKASARKTGTEETGSETEVVVEEEQTEAEEQSETGLVMAAEQPEAEAEAVAAEQPETEAEAVAQEQPEAEAAAMVQEKILSGMDRGSVPFSGTRGGQKPLPRANQAKTQASGNQSQKEQRKKLCRELFQSRQHFEPFEDSSSIFANCIQIMPCDLIRLQRVGWQVGQSTFLLHGFYQYHHLLFGTAGEGTYVIGVPGIMNAQERYMAQMFGFGSFQLSRRRECGRAFGYWYRLLKEDSGIVAHEVQ